MKVVWAFGISLLAAFYISSAMVVGWAESSEKVTEFEPVSLEDASYIDLMDEINRLMSVQPADIEDAETAKETFDRFETMVRGLVKINDLETAAKLANHARKLFPDQVRTAFLAGWVKGLEGNHKEAIDLLLEGLGEKTDILPDPDSTTQSEIKTTLAGFLIESGNAEEAVTYLKELTQDESAGALAHYLAGLAYHQTGDAYQCAKS
ncbi:MAG: tetratricopeptide repeat protein, partial [Candidatus Omnitrophica bacterium]|nr:tetratricopeptide repeat protein [Candidatus Omnitrophota bacterium]